jgi:hypothetical protein
MVFTLDEQMRLPMISRFHFIECGANTGMEWGNVAVPTVQYSHGMISCSEFTGVPLRVVLDLCGLDYRRARYVRGEDADGSSVTRTIPMETVESGEVLLDKGLYSLGGLAWSGRGKVTWVDVSVDEGRHWRPARLETPVLSKCLTRFNLDWVSDGKPALVQSRATDETSYVQPTFSQLRAVRGTRSIHHNHAIQTWLVQDSGEVKNVQLI